MEDRRMYPKASLVYCRNVRKSRSYPYVASERLRYPVLLDRNTRHVQERSLCASMVFLLLEYQIQKEDIVVPTLCCCVISSLPSSPAVALVCVCDL